jgi:rubrerythrin
MNIVRALEMLRKLELKMENLYGHYHELFFYDTEAAGIFLLLQSEEKSHAGLLDYQIRMARKNRDLFQDVEYDMAPLEHLISRIEEAIQPADPVTVERAIAFSLEVETSACEYHYRTLIVQSNPAMEELIRNLGAADQVHAETLGTLAQRVARIQQTSPEP